MAYRDGAARAARRCAALAFVLSLAAGCSGGDSWTAERADGVVMASPNADLYRAAKESYPDDYNRFLPQAAQQAAESGQWTIEGNARRFAERLMIGHFDGVAKAPDAQLVEIANQHVQLMGALRRISTQLCGQFLREGRLPAEGAPQEAVAIKNRIDALMIRAAASGEHGSQAARPEMTQAERGALLETARGTSPEAAQGLADPGGLHSSSEQQCAAGTAIYQTIAGLPADQAAKAIVSLLRPPPAAGGTATGR